MHKVLLFFGSLLGFNLIYSPVVCPQDLFTHANELYTKHNYKEAQQEYLTIASTHDDPHVYYNLGNCAYKQHKRGYALLYWRRAEHNWGLFNREALQHNIMLITQKNPGLSERVCSLIKALSLSYLQIIFLGFWFLLFFTIIYKRFVYRKTFITLLILFIILLSTIITLKYWLSGTTYGVIVSKQTSLRSGPDTTYQILGTLSETQEVTVQKRSGNYLKISVDRQTGWVEKKNIEII